MLQEILNLPTSVTVLLCYVPDKSVLQEIKRYLQRIYQFDINYVESVVDVRTVKQVYGDAVIAPLLGDKWYIEADLDKLSDGKGIKTTQTIVKDIINRTNINSFSILYTTRYSVYKSLLDSTMNAKDNRVICLYGGTLSAKDIYYEYDDVIKTGGTSLNNSLLTYVVRNYRRDVVKFFELMQLLRSGVVVRTRTDIIDLVGLGSITPLKLTVDILSTDLTTKNRCKLALRRWLQAVNDLLHNMSANVLVQQMYMSCNSIGLLKEQQMRGYVIGARREYTNEKEEQQLSRLKQYEDVIGQKITLLRVLWMAQQLSCLLKDYSLAEENILKLLYEYQTMYLKECEDK